MEAQKQYAIETIENAIKSLQEKVDSLKEMENHIDVDVETNRNSSYFTMRIELTVYHDWSES